MKLLIAGDSFAADWTSQYPKSKGWVNLLAEHHDVINVADAGCSEYRILKKIKENYVPGQFDAVIVAHTSPYRLYTQQNPINYKDKLHDHADLIYADIEFHSKSWKNLFNASLQSALGFFKYHYDQKYAEDIYLLIRKEISFILAEAKVVTIATPIVEPRFLVENTAVKISEEQVKIGLANHMDDESNRSIFIEVCNALQK